MCRGKRQAAMMRCHGEKRGASNSEAIRSPPGDVANSDWPPEHRAFYKVAYDVGGGNVDLLDQRRFFRRSKKTDVTKIAHQVALGSGKSHRRNAEFACSAQRGEDVGRASRCRKGKKSVPTLAESANLSFEHLLKTVVVADCREDGSIRTERNGWQRRAIEV
jgi:hypothetical protein